jgi:hypothetical protein
MGTKEVGPRKTADELEELLAQERLWHESTRKDLEAAQQWIADLQSGMYINCVYCGHRYGPNTDVPASMADVLKAHIEKCPKHPMSKLREAVRKLCNTHCPMPSTSACSTVCPMYEYRGE